VIHYELAMDELAAYYWVDAEVVVDRVGGAAAAETWAFDTDYSATATTATAHEVVASVYSWLSAPGREWSGTAMWSYAYSELADGSVGVTYTPSADTWTITPNAAFVALTGLAAVVGGASWGPGGGLDGTVYCEAMRVGRTLRRADGSHAAGLGGGYFSALPYYSGRPVELEAVLDHTGIGRLHDAAAAASHPRMAYVYSRDRGAWVYGAIEPGETSPGGYPGHARWTSTLWVA